ncbi:MAG TPA: hypothetical protein VF993_01300 [Myxococcales bacterium]
MPSFLLTWSPLRYDWTDLPAMARRVRKGRRVLDRWSCARSKQIRKGDRLFMLRQGAEPRGIFASGWAVSDWYEDANWRGPGCCNYLDLVYDALLDPATEAILPREALLELGPMHWDTQMSGIQIPEPVARALEKVWSTRRHAGSPRRGAFGAAAGPSERCSHRPRGK